MSTDPGPVFKAGMQELVSQIRPERALLLYPRADQELAVWEAHGVDPGQVFTSAPVSLSLFRRVYESGEPLLSANAQQEPGLEDISSLMLSEIRSVLCVPIFGQGRVRGLLYADRRIDLRPFSGTDLVRLTNLARDLERRLGGVALIPKPRPGQALEAARARPQLRLDLRARTLILRSLATLLGAGVNLSRGLHLLAEQGETPPLKSVCQALEADVARGFPLYEAMRRAGPFSQLQVQLVRVAEETGGLVEVLRQLAAYEERTREVVMRVRSSLTYPVCLFLVCMAMLILVPPFLLKGQLELLRGAGEEPPAITLALVTVAGLLGSLPGLLALAALATLAWWSLRRLYRSRSGRLWLFRWILSLPRIGPAMRLFATARFARALALQLQVGLSVLDAVPAAGVIASNPVLERALPEVRESLEAGVSLTESLRQSGFFPTPFLSLLTAGEESGKLPATLQWVARLYELELESELEMACAALEPLMMMGMGLAAGLICLATMLPLVKLIQTL